jgi:hypothetical protein
VDALGVVVAVETGDKETAGLTAVDGTSEPK